MAFSLMTRAKPGASATPVPGARKKAALRQRAAGCGSAFESLPLRLHAAELPMGGLIQPKLKIGGPNDEFEQEADRIADEVIRMPASAIQPKPT